MTCRSHFGASEEQLWFKAGCSPLCTGRAEHAMSLCHVVQGRLSLDVVVSNV